MLFYRSVFWLFSTAGHGGFLPGESQFATPSLCEGPNNLDRYYFLTTTAAYLLVPLNMLVQEQGGQIVSFPAVPVSWREVAFHGIPAAGGRRVSGVMANGAIGQVHERLEPAAGLPRS